MLVNRILFFFLLLFVIAGFSSEKFVSAVHDFEKLMCEGDFTQWRCMRTALDFQNLHVFKAAYERNFPFLYHSPEEFRIPKIVHFIWLGPKPFPARSAVNVKGWIDQHPDWICKFWTDRIRELPDPRVQLVLVQDASFTQLAPYYYQLDNYAGRSDLLRYEILYQQGGVYVDHDVVCYTSFAPLHQAFDLYCGIEPLHHSPVLTSCITASNALIGASPKHSILGAMIEEIAQSWDRIDREFGQKNQKVLKMFRHTFLPFHDAFQKYALQSGERNIALPTPFFHAVDPAASIFAWHYFAGTWPNVKVERKSADRS